MDLAYICSSDQHAQALAAAAAAAALHHHASAGTDARQRFPASSTCFFNDCHKEVQPGSWKCVFHRNRARCLYMDCQNQVYARNLCVRHGGKKQCKEEGCTGNARLGNFCSKHGTGSIKKKCTEEGCTKMAHARHKCVRHGGGRKCKMDGCQTHARNGGYCCRHNRQLANDKEAPSPMLYPADHLGSYHPHIRPSPQSVLMKEDALPDSAAANGLEILNLTIERYNVGQVDTSTTSTAKRDPVYSS
ncbi:hypothetical protein H257_07804 [Aphanomyces astaci]|uniref:Uncharacterized protein n=1 Tax=Aphanomyces astaci TaxID=112090 RepID=W4GJE0_APHAT|nr:hypothetical protein H257_07804 [Aphanomyces astaci]ETV79033.1 hypothetical protein H257_07804 [Aphanomyces astaci]KAF0776265.1 hypothetical protein AaE_000035 [Aphanomyces astaci]RHY07247.1 hypothetical protein DYB36_012395 [Aphanomyces astaci]RHY86993.1 hypothetical protein DYB35_006406 [Aphanomyces astaci]RHZ17991.1 hypothetical protein DYB37_006010 [Aphanomyces astaci]|eukprot:XP_009831752.1 hypothetical protein H257_07804 [Aphanomyces astaci]